MRRTNSRNLEKNEALISGEMWYEEKLLSIGIDTANEYWHSFDSIIPSGKGLMFRAWGRNAFKIFERTVIQDG